MVRPYALNVTFLYDKQKLFQPDNVLNSYYSPFFISLLFFFRCSFRFQNQIMPWYSDFFSVCYQFHCFFTSIFFCFISFLRSTLILKIHVTNPIFDHDPYWFCSFMCLWQKKTQRRKEEREKKRSVQIWIKYRIWI